MSNPASVLMARAAPPLAPSLTTTVPTINQSERARNAPAHPTNTQTQIGTSSNSLTHGSTFHSRSGHGHAPSSSVLGPAGTAVFHQTSQGLEHDLDSLPLPNLHPTFRPDAENPGDVLVKVQATHFYVHRDVLYFASPFFRSVLEGGWRESHFSILDTDAESDSISDHEDLSDAEEAEAGYSSALDGDQSWNQKGAEGKVDHDPDQTRRASTRRSSLPLLSHSDAKASPTSPVGPDTPSGSSTSTPSRSTHVPRSSGLLPLAEANGATAVRERRRSASLGAVSVDGSTRASRPALDLAQPARDALTGMSSSGAGLGIAGETAPDSTSKEAHKDRWRTVVTEPSTPRARLAELATPPGSPRFGLSPHVSLSPLKWPENEAEPSLSTTTGTSSKRRERQRGRSTYDPRAAGTTQEKRARAARKKARDGIVAVIQLHEESASVFHDFLFHVYPHLDLLVTWYNVEGLLRLADKFGAPLLKRASLSFLRAALAGKPIEALRLAEAHGLDESFKEASRHVLDNFAAWEMDELALLSGETLLKLERRRTWFLERLLKLGLASPARDYVCHPNCPDPPTCARILDERWKHAYAGAFRFGPPQPSVIFRHLRELEINPPLALSACQSASKSWVQDLFDRMFSLPPAGRTPRQFLSIKLKS